MKSSEFPNGGIVKTDELIVFYGCDYIIPIARMPKELGEKSSPEVLTDEHPSPKMES